MSLLQRYLMDYAVSISDKNDAVLDYGCGGGEMVGDGLNKKLNIFGTDTFYEGGKSKELAISLGLLGKKVFSMKRNRIPFPDRSFDLVICNQVFEHVKELNVVLKEINRILKTGGILLSAFPTKECVYEGHCGIPMIHWFNKESRLRFGYALLLRKIGFGYFKENKKPERWVMDFLNWLDKYTTYRTRKEIFSLLRRYFSQNVLIKDQFYKSVLRSKNIHIFDFMFEYKFCKWLINNCEECVVLSKK